MKICRDPKWRVEWHDEAERFTFLFLGPLLAVIVILKLLTGR